MITKKRIRIATFFLIFIVVSPIVVLYARGDIFTDGWNILKTGGIYVTKAPIGSNIFLNSKPENSTTFFSRDILIKNLRPGTYEVKVTKDGYNTWTNKIKVFDNTVTDANIFILPTKVELKNISKFVTVQSGTTTIQTKTKNQDYTEIAAVFASSSPIISKKLLATTTIDFKLNLGIKNSPIMSGKIGLWQDRGIISVAWFGKNESAPKYLCEGLDCTKTITVFDFKKSLKRINFLPSYENVVVIATDNKIIAIQIQKDLEKIPQTIYEGTNPDFRIINGDLYIKDKDIISQVIL